MTPRIALAVCAALFAAALASGSAGAETPTIYKWIDENGVAHYTTDRSRIPSDIGTRVEHAPSVSAPAPATATHPDDELRDAVRVKPQSAVAAPTPAPTATPTVAAPAPAPAPIAAPVAVTPPVASAPPAVAHAPAPAAAQPKAAAPPAEPADPDPVSAPPPAPVAPLAPKQTAELAKIDGQIQSLEAEISDHEERLAALISTADDQKPLVDDPKFREISQRLPKLQAELQSLREQRNKIQPSATP